MSLSLPTEWRLRSRLSMGYIGILCLLSFNFSSSVSLVSSDCVALTSLALPTEWRLNNSPVSLLLALSPPGAILDALATELQLQSRLSQTECIRLHCSLSFAFCLSLHSLFCLLFLFLMQYCFRFRRNCGLPFMSLSFASSSLTNAELCH
jgi:hypothetical protein